MRTSSMTLGLLVLVACTVPNPALDDAATGETGEAGETGGGDGDGDGRGDGGGDGDGDGESSCGDGVQDEGEACDDGNDIDEDGCLTSCELNVCGDGIVNPDAEQCDDANDDQGDDCFDDCTLRDSPTCDNGQLDPEEFCLGLETLLETFDGLAPAVALADVDGDEHLDLIAIAVASGDVDATVIHVFPGDGTGAFGPRQDSFVGSVAARSMDVGDFDDDGQLDVVWTGVGADEALVSRNEGGTFAPGVAYPPSTSPTQVGEVHRGRLDTDGVDDFVYGFDGANELVAVTGGGSITTGFGFDAGPLAQFGLVDLDGDGRDEAIIADNTNATLRVHAGSGGPELAAHPLVGVSPYELVGADLDGDGAEEAIVTDWDPEECPVGALDCTDGRVIVVPGVSGDPAAVGSIAEAPVGAGPVAVAVGDLDHDDQPDLVVGHAADQRVVFVFAEGAEDLDKVRELSGTITPGRVGLALGDLNEDGALDLVSAHPSESRLSVRLSAP